MKVSASLLKRFVIYMAILTFVMFTVWGFVRSFMDRPPGDYETEVCDIRLKDKKYEQALEAANEALSKTPNHRGAMMCKALVFISEKKYIKADKVLSNLIIFLEENLLLTLMTQTFSIIFKNFEVHIKMEIYKL